MRQGDDAERVAQSVADDNGRSGKRVELDGKHVVLVSADFGASEQENSRGGSACLAQHQDILSTSVVARLTYACAAGSDGLRATTGWPAANASAGAIVRGMTISKTMFAGRCFLT